MKLEGISKDISKLFLTNIGSCFIYSSTNKISSLVVVILLLIKYIVNSFHHSRVIVNLFMGTIIMPLYCLNASNDLQIAMKGQLNADGYVMDFGDVKKVAIFDVCNS